MAVRSNIRTNGSSTKKSPRQPRPPRQTRRNDRLAHDLWGVGLIALGGIGLVGLLAFSHAGQVGYYLADFLRQAFGVGSYVVPFLLGFAGVVLIRGRSPVSRWEMIGSAIVLWLVFIAWWHYGHTSVANELDQPRVPFYGGWIGAGIAHLLRHFFDAGTPIVFLALSIAAIVVMSDMRLLHLVGIGVNGAKKAAGPVKKGTAVVANKARAVSEKRALRVAKTMGDRHGDGEWQADHDEIGTVSTVPALVPLAPARKASTTQPALDMDRLGVAVDHINHEYKLPPLDILTPSPPAPKKMESLIAQKQAILMQTLNDFKIGGNVQCVAIGPTFTRYEVQLEPGILVKKIVALADNLAMSLAAIDVRVEAPIPGKAAIGIEVPNDVTQIVSIRECLETSEFLNAPSKLTFALGKDVAGTYKYADLARMPHLLVGGSTNSGKSVCLNTLITSIVYRATPREVRFVMIDPKRVELSLYDGIPHLLSPVIKDSKQAAGILRTVLKEMDQRYELFSRMSTRNIDGYNAKVELPQDKLPYIVVIIDELADLMMTQGAEVETAICRLAQLARATGIHLVIATQRPSVDVITGTIKANISSRIAFAVATQVDSRTIIDSPGADRLIGRGDMLFLPIDAPKPLRVQGCYVSEKETDTLVKYLREQEEPSYSMTPSDSASGFSDEDSEDDGDNDELFEPCVRWLAQQRQASTSSLQRKFKIGYTRAARIIETMEAKGIVGPQDGVKPREVLLHPENVESYFAGKQQGIMEGL
jgi:S-DNA-T family DNA segregation ATPase FtsK/SpoIIIE